MVYSLVCLILNSVFNILLFRSRTFGLSKFGFVSLQMLIFDSGFQAFLFLPAYVTVSKLIPRDVEASIFSILKAIQALSQLVYGRILGALIQAAIQPEKEFSKVGATAAFGVCICSALFMILLIRMLPDKESILEAQSVLFYNETLREE